MPYSFVQIKQSKSRAIQWSLAFLALLYVVGAVLIVWVVKYFLFRPAMDLTTGLTPSLFSLLDPQTLWWTAGGALALSAGHWFVSTDALIDKTLQYMSGRVADDSVDNERMFRHVVEEASVATGGKYRIEPYLIPTLAMNAFALQDFQGRSVIGITEGLLKRLNREQLEAVVGHEAGHIASGDCLETTVTTVVFKAFDTVCDASRRMLFFGNLSRENRCSSRRDNNSSGSFMVLLLIVFLIALVLKFIGYMGSLFISRQREYRADALAVQLTRNPLALAEALYIIDQRWKGGGIPGETLDAIFILSPRQRVSDDQEDVVSDLLSTHPPVKKRIGILLEMAHAREDALDRAMERANAQAKVISPVTMVTPERGETNVAIPVPGVLAPGMPLPVFGGPVMPVVRDQCPRCRTPLVPEMYEAVSVRRCPSCLGILAGETDILHIVQTKEVQFDDRIRQLARLTRQQAAVLRSYPFDSIYDEKSIVCPACLDTRRRMTRRFINARYPVEVDRCKACALVWFDRDELEILQCLYESDQTIPQEN